MKYFIKTFGCQQNEADSERISSYYQGRGYKPAQGYDDADVVVINTCVVRQQAEDRVYGLVEKLAPKKQENPNFKIVVTGCLVGTALREPTGDVAKRLRKRLWAVDEFLPIDEVGFEYQAVRNHVKKALIPISSGCNNFCTFCIVPFSRGREKSRPFHEIIDEAKQAAQDGYTEIMLLGQNVNSYGADIIKDKKTYTTSDGKTIKPVMVKHLGRMRIPTLFPNLLKQICEISGIQNIEFISSNPWDFSDELIGVISENKNINRLIHLPVQAGDNEVLRRMNRWYSREQYIELLDKIRKKVDGARFSTDIIVGFPGETNKEFEQTVDLAKQARFEKAYIACFSPRPGTAAAKIFQDDVSPEEKMRRFHVLDELINHNRA